MTSPKKRFAVVGGGTAGWLSALILQEAARRSGLSIELTVVESSKIPTIGVGEGTTAVFRGLLLQLGFDEFEFLRETGATIKYGIRHQDWHRVGHSYDGPIDDPHLVCQTPPDVTSSWLNQYCIASERSVTESHLFTYLMKNNCAPFVFEGRETPLPVGPFHHAYHFDQALVGKYLRGKAKDITIVDAVVTGAEHDPESGDITTLVLDGADDLPVDFVIDCTGFRRALIRGEMGADWVSYGDRLPVNRAMPFWLDHAEGADISPYTLAAAQGAGWMWQIPTYERMGCGYVYSDQFLTPDQAQAEIETALGHPIEPRNDIKIDAGRLDRAWIGNCLAVGLAQSFFEPLEATSIHGTIVQMMLFGQFHLGGLGQDDAKQRDSYNDQIAQQLDDFCTFINLHYVTERDDTPFWQHVRENCIGPEIRNRLLQWSVRTPRREDFAPFPGGLAHIEEQLYYPVLDGLGLTNRDLAREELGQFPQLRSHARASHEALVKEFKRVATQAPGHRAFLDSLHQ